MDFPILTAHRGIISSYGRETIGPGMRNFATGQPASTAWVTANEAVFVPMSIRAPFYCTQVWWLNGGTLSGNVDVGLYTIGGTRLLSGGSVAAAGANATQAVNLGTAVLLNPGPYYLAMAMSSGTGTYVGMTSAIAKVNECFGRFTQGSALPLPTTVTPATGLNAARYPIFGILDITLKAL